MPIDIPVGLFIVIVWSTYALLVRVVFAKINYVQIHVIRRQRRLRLRRQLLLRLALRVVAAKSRCWTLQPSPPTTTGYFLVAHCVIAGDPFFEACREEYGVDLRRKLFRCDRPVSLTFILHGGRTKVTKDIRS